MVVHLRFLPTSYWRNKIKSYATNPKRNHVVAVHKRRPNLHEIA